MPQPKQPDAFTAEKFKALIGEELAILAAGEVIDPVSAKVTTTAGPLHGDQVKILRDLLEDKDNFAALCNTLQQEYKHYDQSPDLRQWISHALRTRIETLKEIGINGRLKSRNQVKLALEQIGIYAGIEQEAEELAESIVNGNTKLLALFRKTEKERAEFLASPLGAQKIIAVKFVSEILRNETKHLRALEKMRDLNQRYKLFKPILDQYEQGNHDIVKIIGLKNKPGITLSKNQLEDAFNRTYNKMSKIKGKVVQIKNNPIPKVIPPGSIIFLTDIKLAVENENLAALLTSESKKDAKDEQSLTYKINAALEEGKLDKGNHLSLVSMIKILAKSNIADTRKKMAEKSEMISGIKLLLRKANLFDEPEHTSALLPRDILSGKILIENLLRKKYLELGGDKSPWPTKNIPALHFLKTYWNDIVYAYSQQTNIRSNLIKLLSKLPDKLTEARNEADNQIRNYPQKQIIKKDEVTNTITEFYQKQIGFAKDMQQLTKLRSGLINKDPRDQFVMDFLISPFLRLSDDKIANPFGEPTATSSLLGRAANIANMNSKRGPLTQSLECFKDCAITTRYLTGFIDQHFGDDAHLVQVKRVVDSMIVQPASQTFSKYESLLKDIVEWLEKKAKKKELELPETLVSEIGNLVNYIHNQVPIIQQEMTYEVLEKNFCHYISGKLAEKDITISEKKDDLIDLYFTLKQEERANKSNKKLLNEYMVYIEHFFKQTIVHHTRLPHLLLKERRFTDLLFSDEYFKKTLIQDGRFTGVNLNDSKSRIALLQNQSFINLMINDPSTKVVIYKYINSLKQDDLILTIDKVNIAEAQESQQSLPEKIDHLFNQMILHNPPLLSSLLKDLRLIDILVKDEIFKGKLKDFDIQDSSALMKLAENEDFKAIVAGDDRVNKLIGQYFKTMAPDDIARILDPETQAILRNKKDPLLLKFEIVKQLTKAHENEPGANPHINEDLRNVETQLKVLQVLSTSPVFEMTYSLTRYSPLAHENVINAQKTLSKTAKEFIRLEQHYTKSAAEETAALTAKGVTAEAKKIKPLYFFKKPSREREKIDEWLREHPTQVASKVKR